MVEVMATRLSIGERAEHSVSPRFLPEVPVRVRRGASTMALAQRSKLGYRRQCFRGVFVQDPNDAIPAKFATLGLTYDDVLLLPGETDVVPAEVDPTSR